MREKRTWDTELPQAITDNYPRYQSGSLFQWIHNTKITTLLVVGLGLILSLVLILGFIAYSQSSKIWEQTQGLYEHPLKIRRAVAELTLDMMNMKHVLDESMISTSDTQNEALLQSSIGIELNAEKQLEIISIQYLGPGSDVDALISSYTAWKKSREETIRLVQDNKMVEAQQRYLPGGVNDILMKETLKKLEIISAYAIARGDKFYQDAQDQYNSLRSRLIFFLIFIGIFTLLISYVLISTIRSPLKELTVASEKFQAGDYATRIDFTSRNEIGVLAASLNQLAKTIEADLINKDNSVYLASSMLFEYDLNTFCKNSLDKLIHVTGSEMGAIYLLNANQTHYEHYVSIGLDAAGQASFSALTHEGEFGKALLHGEIQHIRDIPVESTIHLRTVSADLKPCEIITMPLKLGNEIPAVISLASLQAYSPDDIRLLNEIQNLLSARFNGVMASEQIRQFSEKLEHQNSELQTQQRNQVLLTQELNEQNIELEQQKKQLSQVNQIKSTFISSMSHELRTPLNSIIALSGVLNRHLMDAIPDEEYSYLEVIERNGKNLLNLINDILDISRLEAGKQEVNLSRFSMHELTSQVTDLISPQARQKDIELQNSVPDDLPSLISDQTVVTHILQNLVANAVKFTDIGRVEVCGRQVGENLQIDVVDTGIGIPAEQLPYIFDEFRQGDEGNARKYGGTGLGLSIAQRYTDLLKGSLKVVSTPGKGTTFSLVLPIALDPADFDEDELGEETWNQSAAGIRSEVQLENKVKCILLVDDNEPTLIQMTDMLSEQGYSILVARNGQEALEQMGTQLPDAIILDLMMPTMGGFEVLAKIRSTERTSALPVLILTAMHISKEELKFLKKNNVHQLIQKGNISRKELLEAVGKMVFPAEQAPVPLPAAIKRKKPGDQLVILVVEDNPDNMLAARALLKDTCRLLEARDGQAGVDQARLHKPDLILMDISLPIMDGIQALQTLRADVMLANIPVVALTASAMKGSREEILAYGFDAYVAKPIDPMVLTNTIQEVLFGK